MWRIIFYTVQTNIKRFVEQGKVSLFQNRHFQRKKSVLPPLFIKQNVKRLRENIRAK